MIIKLLLIFCVLAAMAFVARGTATGRHLAIRRLAGLAFSACWIVAVIAPESVTRVANLIGVGRGTDLVLYVVAVAFLFTAVAQRQHLRDLNDRIGQLTREIALMSAPTGECRSRPPPDDADG